MPAQEVKTLLVTLRRSLIGIPWTQKRTLEALGLRRRFRCVEKPNSPRIRGMLKQVGAPAAARPAAAFS
jgi:ribosomal protein L30